MYFPTGNFFKKHEELNEEAVCFLGEEEDVFGCFMLNADWLNGLGRCLLVRV